MKSKQTQPGTRKERKVKKKMLIRFTDHVQSMLQSAMDADERASVTGLVNEAIEAGGMHFGPVAECYISEQMKQYKKTRAVVVESAVIKAAEKAHNDAVAASLLPEPEKRSPT